MLNCFDLIILIMMFCSMIIHFWFYLFFYMLSLISAIMATPLSDEFIQSKCTMKLMCPSVAWPANHNGCYINLQKCCYKPCICNISIVDGL